MGIKKDQKMEYYPICVQDLFQYHPVSLIRVFEEEWGCRRCVTENYWFVEKVEISLTRKYAKSGKSYTGVVQMCQNPKELTVQKL